MSSSHSAVDPESPATVDSSSGGATSRPAAGGANPRDPDSSLHGKDDLAEQVLGAQLGQYDNPNPLQSSHLVFGAEGPEEVGPVEPYDDDELQDCRDMIWDLVSEIKDPEFEYSLERLRVVTERRVAVARAPDGQPVVTVIFRPTVPHCSQALTIGLCLAHAVSSAVRGLKYRVAVLGGTHKSEHEITKQVNDKERVAAAMENPALQSLVASLLKGVRGGR